MSQERLNQARSYRMRQTVSMLLILITLQMLSDRQMYPPVVNAAIDSRRPYTQSPVSILHRYNSYRYLAEALPEGYPLSLFATTSIYPVQF